MIKRFFGCVDSAFRKFFFASHESCEQQQDVTSDGNNKEDKMCLEDNDATCFLTTYFVPDKIIKH